MQFYLDLTQAELASQVGCAPVTVKKIEADELRPSRQLAEILVRHLGVAADDREALIRFVRGGVEPSTASAKIPKNNLPIELSSLIGREREQREIKESALASRLVTLTGVGGVGKTRLSIQVGVELLDQFMHGVWFVELAPISNPDALPAALLAIFRLSEQENKSGLEILQEYLQPKKLLIILDNCEHLIEAATHFALALLKNAPALKILATSREGLSISGEQIYQVPPLALPDLKQDNTGLAQLTQYEAVQLFIERASQASAKFQINNDNAPALAQICYRLDGLPLAIELAAARTRMMGLDQINARLDDRFRLLTGGSRTALPRQKTLLALIDWSYDLLSAPEQLLLQRVSVFVNGWTVEAALQVCSDDKLEGNAPFELLSNLIDKSLIQLDEHSDGARYRILETIRQYAHEKLLGSGESDHLRERHLAYFHAFAEEAKQKLRTPAKRITVYQLQADLDNIRAALAWAFSEGRQPEVGLHLACALEKFTHWDALLLREQSEWYQKGLALLSKTDQALNLIRAKALCLAGGLESHFGNYLPGQLMLEEGVALYRSDPQTERKELSLALNSMALVYYMDDVAKARTLAEESISLSRSLGETDKWYLAEALRMTGWVAFWQNDLELARVRAEEGVALFRQLGDEFSITDTLHLLGQIAHLKGDYATARPYYAECLQLNQNNGLKEYEMLALFSLAELDQLTGNYSAARARFNETLEFYQDHGDAFSEGKTLINLAKLAILEGKPDEAVPMLHKGLTIFRQMYRYIEMALSLHTFADSLQARGKPDRALYFLGTIDKVSRHFKPIYQTAYTHSIAVLKEALEHDAFVSAWEKGLSTTVDDAVALALNDNE